MIKLILAVLNISIVFVFLMCQIVHSNSMLCVNLNDEMKSEESQQKDVLPKCEKKLFFKAIELFSDNTLTFNCTDFTEIKFKKDKDKKLEDSINNVQIYDKLYAKIKELTEEKPFLEGEPKACIAPWYNFKKVACNAINGLSSLCENIDNIVKEILNEDIIKKYQIDIKQVKKCIFNLLERKSIFEEFKTKNCISAENLQKLRHKITMFYLTRGYINSGAIIHNQNLKENNDTIKIKIIEGKLKDNDITINSSNIPKKLNEKYIKNKIAMATSYGEKPLNLHKLKNRLSLLKMDPHIDSLSAQLKPGVELGEALLNIEVTEKKHFPSYLLFSDQIGVKFNNYNSVTTGPYMFEYDIEKLNLTGAADSLDIKYKNAYGFNNLSYDYKGLTDWSIDYKRPFFFKLKKFSLLDSAITFHISQTHTDIEIKPINRFNITNKSIKYKAEFSTSLIKTPSFDFITKISCENYRSKSYIFNGEIPFSFSGGKDGINTTSVARLSFELFRNTINYYWFLSTILSKDIYFFPNNYYLDRKPDSKFITWQLFFQGFWRKNDYLFDLDYDILVKIHTQLTCDPLLPSEKFIFGGRHTVRGYRENKESSDIGANSSLELRVPILKNINKNIKYKEFKIDKYELNFCLFADYGYGIDLENEYKSLDKSYVNLFSFGSGLRWEMKYGWNVGLESKKNKKRLKYKKSWKPKISSELYWGIKTRLKDNDYQNNDDLQNHGIHFQINFQLM